MDDDKKRLKHRLDHAWKPPDFSSLFITAKRRPIQLIRKSTIIFNSGDPLGRLYYIKEGYVKIYRLSEEGKETTSYLLGPGNILGVRTLLTKDDRTLHTAEALTNVKVITMSRKECFDSLAKRPDYLIDLLQVFRERLSFTERRYESFIYASTTTRVAIFLADCAERFGIKENSEVRIDMELTHQKIADFVGAFRETVTLSLHRLEAEGIIEIERGQVTVLQLRKLKSYALFGKK